MLNIAYVIGADDDEETYGRLKTTRKKKNLFINAQEGPGNTLIPRRKEEREFHMI